MSEPDGEAPERLRLEFAVLKRREELARAERRRRVGIAAVIVAIPGICATYLSHVTLNDGQWSWLHFAIFAVLVAILAYGIHARIFPGVVPYGEYRGLYDLLSNDRRKVVGSLRLALEWARANLHSSPEYRDANPEDNRAGYKDDSLLYVEDLRKESKRNRRANNVLQVVIIAGSLFATSLSSLSQSMDPIQLASIGCSLAVGISAGITGYFKFKDRSFYAQQTADAIEHEAHAVSLGIGRYSEAEDPIRLFTEEVHRLRLEQKKREQNLDQPEPNTDKRQ